MMTSRDIVKSVILVFESVSLLSFIQLWTASQNPTYAQSTVDSTISDSNSTRIVTVKVGQEVEFPLDQLVPSPLADSVCVTLGPIGLQKSEGKLKFTGHHFLLGDNLCQLVSGKGDHSKEHLIIFRVEYDSFFVPCNQGEIDSFSLSPDSSHLLIRLIQSSETTFYAIDLQKRELVGTVQSRYNCGGVAWEKGFAMIEYEVGPSGIPTAGYCRTTDLQLKRLADIEIGIPVSAHLGPKNCSCPLINATRLWCQTVPTSPGNEESNFVVVDLDRKTVAGKSRWLECCESVTEVLKRSGKTYFVEDQGKGRSLPLLLGSGHGKVRSAPGFTATSALGLLTRSIPNEPERLLPFSEGRYINPGYRLAQSTQPWAVVERNRDWLAIVDYHWNPLEILRFDMPSEFHAQIDDKTILSVAMSRYGQKHGFIFTFLPILQRDDVVRGEFQLLPPENVPLPIKKNFTANFAVANATGNVTYQILYPEKGVKINPNTGAITMDLAVIWKEHLSILRQSPQSCEPFGHQIDARKRGIKCNYTSPAEGFLEMALPIVAKATDSTGAYDVFAAKFIVHVPEEPILKLIR